MRSLSLTCSVLAILAPVVGAIRVRALRPTLLVMATLFGLSLFPLQYAVELRNYSFAMAAGSVATVVWAGLLTGQLPRTGRWIFLLAFSGALGGFAHYYGNLLYASLLLVLGLAWLGPKPRRPLYVLLTWGSASFVPVVGWYFLTRRWSPNLAVADPPTWGELRTWLQYAFSPFSNSLAHQPPGYPDGTPGTGTKMLVGVAVMLLFAAAWGLVVKVRNRSVPIPTTSLLGVAALLALSLGVGMAWILSLALPPSMNVRNLSALLPVLFLAAGCAVTPGRHQVGRCLGAALAVGLMIGMSTSYVHHYGVETISPPWQQTAGYRDLANYVLTAHDEDQQVACVGIEQPWDWHGDVSSALRAQRGTAPTSNADSDVIPVLWVRGADDPLLAQVAAERVVLFGYGDDGRTNQLISWAHDHVGSCVERTFGQPGFGNMMLTDCSGSP